ncbi:MAG: tagaturonate reductase [Defluviitaleaceae bacterium]|nr:tagaturonate reductase [Defluviitaleaceae bacterium]
MQQNRPEQPDEKVLQFGEGNFLRAFVDYFIDELNGQGLFNGRVAVIQPIPSGLADTLNAQECKYTVVLRGLEDGRSAVKKRQVTCISRAINPYTSFNEYMATVRNPHLRYIVSNTTEAGISFVKTDKLTSMPPVSFPAKITVLLYERFKFYKGNKSKGFIFIPCELIDDNGTKLKKIILRYASMWRLPQGFIDWIHEANCFTNTLVDRIVTGYPKDEIDALTKELGYKDDLLVTGEIFHFFAIEATGDAAEELKRDMPFQKAGLNVVLTDDVTPYKLRKVRILNGAHTMSVLAAHLCGIETVGEMAKDSLFANFLQKGIYNEVIPTILKTEARLDPQDLNSFAASVFDRFANPYIKHYLLSIALNSVSKFTARVLPTILEFYKHMDTLPPVLTLSFAALLVFYKNKENVSDDTEILETFSTEWGRFESETQDIGALVAAICAKTEFWGTNLTSLPGFCEKVSLHLKEINANGMRHTIEKLLGDYA